MILAWLCAVAGPPEVSVVPEKTILLAFIAVPGVEELYLGTLSPSLLADRELPAGGAISAGVAEAIKDAKTLAGITEWLCAGT